MTKAEIIAYARANGACIDGILRFQNDEPLTRRQDWKRADTVLFLNPNNKAFIHILVKGEIGTDTLYDCSPSKFE